MKRKFKPDFGSRLREERERLGYTQEDFAAAAGLRRLTQYLYENEDNVPNLRYLIAIEELGADLHYLIFGRRDKPGGLVLTPEMLRKIFTVVDEVGRNRKGNLLPLKERLQLFSTLCAVYEDKEASELQEDAVRMMLAG